MGADGKRLQAAQALNGAEANHALAVERQAKAADAVAEMEAWQADYAQRVEAARAACRDAKTPVDRLAAVGDLNAVLAELDEEMAKRVHRVRSEWGTAQAEHERACRALDEARFAFDAAVAS